MIDKPGIYENIPETDYHADPCPQPSLSSSVARVLLSYSPRHAWHAHPRLNPNFEPEQSKRFDLGTTVHTIILRRGRDIVEVEAPDFRTKGAQAMRDQAYADGKTPVLTKDLKTAKAMAESALVQLRGVHGAEKFFLEGAGRAETTLAWQEGPVWCRSRLDWLPNEAGQIVDFKTISSSARPEGLGRRIADQSYEVQAAFYERGLIALEPSLAGRVSVVFVFQETDPPHALSAVTLDAGGMDIGREKVEQAIELWTRCLSENRWPSYPATITEAQYPTWALTFWNDRQARDHYAREDGKDPFSLLRADPHVRLD